jgi:hypothetical protein
MPITVSARSTELSSHIQSQLHWGVLEAGHEANIAPHNILHLKWPDREFGLPPSCDKVKKFTCSPATRLHTVVVSFYEHS